MIAEKNEEWIRFLVFQNPEAAPEPGEQPAPKDASVSVAFEHSFQRRASSETPISSLSSLRARLTNRPSELEGTKKGDQAEV